MAKVRSINGAEQVAMDVAVVLSTVRISLSKLLNCAEGQVFEMEKRTGDPAVVEVNGLPFAQGEVVTIGENFAVRITQLLGDDTGR